MRRIPLLWIFFVFVIFLGAAATLMHAFPQMESSPELKVLDAWTGHWTTQGKAYDTPYSHAGAITITMTCGWSANGGFMICDHLISGPPGQHDELSIFTYNPADKSYKFCGFDRTGMPRATPLTIEGNVWSYDSNDEDNGKKIHIRTINDFSKPGIVSWNTKFTSDGGPHWTLMNEGIDTRDR